MARRPYVQLAGDLSGWPKGFVPTPAFLRNLDQYSSELVNGDEGGTWAPSDPLVLGPYGTPTLTVSDGSLLSGDIETVAGNSDGDEIDAIPGLVLTGSAVPAFVTPRTRDIVVGFTNCFEADSAQATNIPRSVVDPLTLGLQPTVSISNARMFSVVCPIRAQHRGATISSIDFRVVVAGVHAAVPGTAMRVRMVKMTTSGVLALHTNAAPYDSSGWYIDQAATVAAFTNNGQVRTLTYEPDQNNTNIDPATEWFMLQMRTPSGTPFIGSLFLSATVHLSAIADFRQE